LRNYLQLVPNFNKIKIFTVLKGLGFPTLVPQLCSEWMKTHVQHHIQVMNAEGNQGQEFILGACGVEDE
jgi:hypothetical protein